MFGLPFCGWEGAGVTSCNETSTNVSDLEATARGDTVVLRDIVVISRGDSSLIILNGERRGSVAIPHAR